MKTYFRLRFLLLLICIGNAAFAQEDATARQYLFNMLNINPAYAGTRGGPSITAGFHKQWLGVPGSPQTGIFSIDAPIYSHHLGAGLQLYDNRLGMERTSGLNASFSTMLKFDEEDEFLSIGLQAGLMNYRVDRTSVALPYQNDPAFQNNTNVLMPTAGIGLLYQKSGFFASLSAPSLLISTVKVDKVISTSSPSLKNMQLLFLTGLSTPLSDDIEFKPSLFFKWKNNQVFEVHVNSSIWIKDLIGLGFSYRKDDAIMGIGELRINRKLSFGYSYGRSIGDKVYFTQATHEALIRFNLGSSDED